MRAGFEMSRWMFIGEGMNETEKSTTISNNKLRKRSDVNAAIVDARCLMSADECLMLDVELS